MNRKSELCAVLLSLCLMVGFAAEAKQSTSLTPAQLVVRDAADKRAGRVDRVAYAVIPMPGAIVTAQELLSGDAKAMAKVASLTSVHYLGGKMVSKDQAYRAGSTKDSAARTMSLTEGLPGYYLCDPCINFEPSILHGRTQQYLIGARYVNTTSPGLCYDTEAGFVAGRSTINWTMRPGFGGHDSVAHVADRPATRMEWTGDNPVSAGEYDGRPTVNPTIDPHPTMQINFTADDTAEEQLNGVTNLKMIFPETAGDLDLQVTELVCHFEDGDTVSTGIEGYSGTNFIYRLQMHLDLVAIPDLDSSGLNAKLEFERTGSHGTSAPYGTQNTLDKLYVLIEKYGECIGETQTSTLSSEAVSTINGGLYDINKKWYGSHRNHRAGEDVDIGLSALASSQAKRDCLLDASIYAEFAMPVASESLVLDNGHAAYGPGFNHSQPHIHIWNGDSHFYPLDQILNYWL